MKNRKGYVLMTTGFLLIAAALCLTFYNIFGEWRAGREADSVISRLPDEMVSSAVGSSFREQNTGFPEDDAAAVPDYILNPEMEMPTVSVDGIAYIGVLTIPVMHRSLPVISEWDDSKLKTAPCRYEGSAYMGNLIIAGHNYRSHFGNLRSLTIGDEVIFTDADGNVFYYQVTDLELLADTSVEGMQAGDWDLTLFTCTWSGRDRVTVRCKRRE